MQSSFDCDELHVEIDKAFFWDGERITYLSGKMIFIRHGSSLGYDFTAKCVKKLFEDYLKALVGFKIVFKFLIEYRFRKTSVCLGQLNKKWQKKPSKLKKSQNSLFFGDMQDKCLKLWSTSPKTMAQLPQNWVLISNIMC